MATPLDNYPALRQAIYTAFWVISLLLGCAQVAYSSQGSLPAWLVVCGQVYLFLGGAIGYMAQANIQNSQAQGSIAPNSSASVVPIATKPPEAT